MGYNDIIKFSDEGKMIEALTKSLNDMVKKSVNNFNSRQTTTTIDLGGVSFEVDTSEFDKEMQKLEKKKDKIEEFKRKLLTTAKENKGRYGSSSRSKLDDATQEKIDKKVSKKKGTKEEVTNYKKQLEREAKLVNAKESYLQILKKINLEETDIKGVEDKYNALIKLKNILLELKELSSKTGSNFNKTGNIGKLDLDKQIFDMAENMSSLMEKAINNSIAGVATKKEGVIQDKITQRYNEILNTKRPATRAASQLKTQEKELNQYVEQKQQVLQNLEKNMLSSLKEYVTAVGKLSEEEFEKEEKFYNRYLDYMSAGGNSERMLSSLDEFLKNNPNIGKKYDKEFEGGDNFITSIKRQLEELKDISSIKEQITQNNYTIKSSKPLLNQIEELDKFIAETIEAKKANEEFLQSYDIAMTGDEATVVLQARIELLEKTLSEKEKLIAKLQNAKNNSTIVNSDDNSKIQQQLSETDQEVKELNTDLAQAKLLLNGISNVSDGKISDNKGIGISPNIDNPQAFVDEITQQLKGHSVKVDVELNSENVAEEIKKITEMIPDKKEIEISFKQDDLYNSLNHWKNENSSSTDMGMPEQIMAANTKTGYTTNPNIKGKVAGISSNLINEVIDSATEDINAIFHSHPEELTSAFSFDDIEIAAKLLSKGITEQYVVTLNDIAKLDLSNFTGKDVKNISNKLKELTMETFEYDGQLQTALKEEEALMNAFSNDLKLQVNKIFNDIFSQLHNNFNGNTPIDLNELNNNLLNEYNKVKIATDGDSEKVIEAISNLYSKVTKTFKNIDVSIFDDAFTKAIDNMKSRIMQEFQEEMLKQAISDAVPHINPNDVYQKLSYSDFKNKLEIETSSRDIELNPILSKTFDANNFIHEITDKLLGKEVLVDVAPSENTDNFLKRLSSYSDKFNALMSSQNNLENFSSSVTENLKEQEVKIDVVPNITSPQEFANDVTAQLKGVKAEINVTPKITDKDISKLIGEQKKSKPTITDAPKLNANGLIDKYNLKRKDIDTSVAAKVKELSKSINSLTAEVIETNSDNTWESLVQHIRELGNVLNSFGKIKLDNAQFESVLKVAEQLKGSRVFIDDNIKNDILSTASVDNLRQLNNEFINLGVTFTVTKEQATNLDNVWDEFIQETNRFDLSDISTGAERITAVIEELREAKQVLYGEKGYVSAESYGSSDMVTYLEQIEKAQQKQAKANPDQSALYQKTIDAIRREKQALTELASEVSNVTTSVDDKTNAFREEEQVVTGTVQREIGELERLAGQLRSVQDDVEKIATTITSLPKIDFDVDLSKLNIENIDGASIASFNAFREQLAGLEAQLNVSNLSSKLVEISNAFTTLSGLKLDNLNTKNLNLTRITNLIKQTEGIEKLADALMNLEECLERLKNDGSFDKDYFTGLKFSAKNVNNMADMAVALETVGIALRQFDKEAKDALSSINKLAENAKGLKNLSSIIKAPKKVKKVQEAIENEDKPKGPTTAQTNKANTIDDNISNGTYEKELKQVEQRYAKLQDTVDITQGKAKELSEAFKDLKEADTVESKIQAFDNFKNALASAKNELTGLEKERSTKSFTDEVNTQLKSIQEQYSNSSYLKNSLSSLETEIERISASAKEGSADLTNLGKQAKTAFANFQKGVLPSGDFKGTFSGLEDAVEQAKKTVDSYSKVKSELKTPLQLNDDGIAKMTAQVIDFNGQLKNLTFVYNDTTKSMVQQTTNVRTELLGIPGVVDAIKHKLKDMAVYWTATLFDPYDILSSFRQVAEVVIDLNSQMTELAKVSGLSIDQLENRFGKWANTAKELGATVSDTISASADWSRLGYSIDEAEKLAEVAILYKNVGDGIDIEAANESLVSTMQGFQLEANQAESVIDSFNEVSNNFAISSAGIGEALQRSASSFYAANTDLNSAIALITATNSVVQDPTRVGNMWKTVSMRIRGKNVPIYNENYSLCYAI